MDIVDFLEPVIEKRTEEIMDEVLKGETEEDYKRFVELLLSIDPMVRIELENYYLNSVQEAVKTSYRKGVIEASALKRLL